MDSQQSGREALSEEAQLLREGHQLLGRALRLITETRKVKIWVPVLCSIILTLYYLYTLHVKTVRTTDDLKPVVDTPPVAVAETAPVSNTGTRESLPTGADVTPDTDSNDLELRKRAEEAHVAQQYAEEAHLWKQFMEKSATPQEAFPQIGNAYERAGDLDGALQAFQRCASLDRANLDTLTAFAYAL